MYFIDLYRFLFLLFKTFLIAISDNLERETGRVVRISQFILIYTGALLTSLIT